MSPQHGVSSSLASIETTPPTTSGSQPSAPSIDSSSVSISSHSEQRSSSASSFSSSKVHIPKLSTATTELLARVTGNIRREQQQQQQQPPPPPPQRNETNPIRWTNPSFSQGLHNFRSIQPASKMRASSTIIELPTAPFVYSSHMTSKTPAAPQQTLSPNASTLPQENHGNPSHLIAIAPRPPGPPSADLVAATQPPMPSPVSPQPVAPAVPAVPTAPAVEAASAATPLTKPKRPAVDSRQRKSTTSINGAKRTQKRRRSNRDGEDIIRAHDSSSDESDITPAATQTKSGRQVNRPSLYVPTAPSPVASKASNNGSQGTPGSARKRKRVSQKGKDLNINCMHCQRGHSPMSNVIVFCDQCNRAWHQLCHDPPIETEFVTVKEKEWHCRGCQPVKITITQPTVVRSNPHLSGPSFSPQTHLPLAVPRLDTGGEGFSTDERRSFLSTLSHAALVEVLVNLSSTHPAIPMFPDDLRRLPASKFSFQPNASTASTPLSSIASSTPALTNSVNSTSGAGEDIAPANFDPRKRYIDESSDDEPEYEVEEHRLYPRAGNGVRLPVNAVDLDIMREDPQCSTFSYMLHGPAQAQAKVNGMAPVWGS